MIVFLLLVASAMGIEFGGTGLNGASGGLGSQTQTGKQVVITAPPRLVVEAVGINPLDLYASSSLTPVPSFMFVPLVGVHITLSTQGGPLSPFRRLPAVSLTTNSSGMASTTVLPGDYEAVAVGTTFNLGTVLTLKDNTTTVLSIKLQPTHQAVTAVKVVSPDTIAAAEPTSHVYALLDSAAAPSTGFSILMGLESNINLPSCSARTCSFDITEAQMVSMNATLEGSYLGPQGSWAILEPMGTYTAYPVNNVVLFQIVPLAEVIYTAG